MSKTNTTNVTKKTNEIKYNHQGSESIILSTTFTVVHSITFTVLYLGLKKKSFRQNI
jgi:hypothetical protein